MRKRIYLLITLLFSFTISFAQTNTFPDTGRVGINTLSPLTKLHINSDLGGISALGIGFPNSSGNINVPLGGSPGGYNIDFYTWRDVVPNQVGARIRAERINNYLANNALVQAMDLSFSTSHGGVPSDLIEKMRITSSGNVGIGTATPKVKLDINVGGGGSNGTVGLRLASLMDYPSLELGIENNYDGMIRTFGNDLKIYAGNWRTVGSAATENHAIYFYTSKSGSANWSTAKMVLNHDGNLGIGTANPAEKLSVNGKIRAHEIKVEIVNWPDYVFEKRYELPSLTKVEKYIKEKGHLPNIPSAEEVKANGIDLGEMNARLLKKIEELTLYVIEKDKQFNNLEKRLESLENKSPR